MTQAVELERLRSLDVLRGIAIAVMLVLHRLHYHWPPLQVRGSLGDHLSGWMIPFIVLVIILFTMAGLFYLLSGTVNVRSKLARTSAAGGSVRPMLALGLFQGVFLLVAHFLHGLLLTNGTLPVSPGAEPEFPIGQINGFIRAGEVVTFHWAQVTTAGTLSVLGLITIFSTLLFALLFRKDGLRKSRRNQIVLGVTGIAIIVGYPFVASLVNPIHERALAEGRPVLAFLTGQVSQTFGVFPHLGIALVGAVVGLRVVDSSQSRGTLRFMLRSALLSVGVALLGILWLAGSGQGMSRHSPATGGVAAILGLGIFLLWEWQALRLAEFSEESLKARRLARWSWYERLGRFSLTVFLLEPLLGEIVHSLLALVLGADFAQSLVLVTLMGFLCIFLWDRLLRLWERAGCVGTAEWVFAHLARKITGQQTTKWTLLRKVE